MRCGRGILREAGFRTTSLGISPSGVLDMGGVFVSDGGNPRDDPEGTGGVLGAPDRMPAALRRSSKAVGFGIGVEVDPVDG